MKFFAKAFNERDLDGMASVLAPDATAQVLGAPFPEEVGAAAIRETSFPHICGAELDLAASWFQTESSNYILLREDQGRGPIDTVLDCTFVGPGVIERIEYLVAPHMPQRLAAFGRRCGLPTVAD